MMHRGAVLLHVVTPRAGAALRLGELDPGVHRKRDDLRMGVRIALEARRKQNSWIRTCLRHGHVQDLPEHTRGLADVRHEYPDMADTSVEDRRRLLPRHLWLWHGGRGSRSGWG